MNPNAIAQEIRANCDAYAAGIINRARWDAEQSRLWKSAADAHLVSVVLALVAPSSVRRQTFVAAPPAPVAPQEPKP